jgi:hypothetical protein
MSWLDWKRTCWFAIDVSKKADPFFLSLSATFFVCVYVWLRWSEWGRPQPNQLSSSSFSPFVSFHQRRRERETSSCTAHTTSTRESSSQTVTSSTLRGQKGMVGVTRHERSGWERKLNKSVGGGGGHWLSTIHQTRPSERLQTNIWKW